MNSELQQTLYDDFPALFDNIHRSPIESPMAFGIECGNGWYDLIRSVCWEIKQHEQNIISRTTYIQKEKDPNFISEYYSVKFDQIKEKLGGLRIYFNGGDDYVEGLVSMAECMSYKICENCGNKGKPNKGGWITTLCDACRQS